MSTTVVAQPGQADKRTVVVRTRAALKPRSPVATIPADERAALEMEYGSYAAGLVVRDYSLNWRSHIE